MNVYMNKEERKKMNNHFIKQYSMIISKFYKI